MVLYSAIKVLSVLCSIHFFKKLLTAGFSDCQQAWDLYFLLACILFYLFKKILFNNSFFKMKADIVYLVYFFYLLEN